MSKKLIQDIVKIKVVKKENRRVDRALDSIQIESKALSTLSTKPRYGIWLLAGACLIFLFFALSFLFSKATVTINPKMQNSTLDENLSASKDSTLSDLSFDLVSLEGEEEKVIQVSQTKEVAERARGTAILYNAFSPSPQRLDIDTRLEGSNGKIYKTTAQLIVPGVKKDGTPGSVEVKIYAAEAGPSYNSPPLDFKIFGFKGTSKYSKFYGRSKGEITGGFKGRSPVLTDTEKSSLENELKGVLREKLSKKARDQIPAGFILFENASGLNVHDITAEPLPGEASALFSLKATFYDFLLNEKKLTDKIARDFIEDYDGSEVYISNIKSLTFTLPAQAGLPDQENISFKDVKNINFNLSDTAQIVWKFDAEKLRSELLGKSKKEIG